MSRTEFCGRRAGPIIALLAAACCGSALGEANLDARSDPDRVAEINRRLQREPLLMGEFSQDRTLVGLNHPLRSSGRFVFWRDRGLYWETLEPFYQATTFTPGDLINWGTPAGPALPPAPDDPAQRAVTRILLAVFSADFDAIDGMFDGEWVVDGERWSLVLRPANRMVGQIVEDARLSGSEHLESLLVAGRSGDRNRLDFSGIQALSTVPPAVCARFSRAPLPDCAGETAPSTAP